MSSEEMRIELESFVNQGLRKGWRGWPRKGPREGVRRGFCVARTTVGRLGGLRAGFDPDAASVAFGRLAIGSRVPLS